MNLDANMNPRCDPAHPNPQALNVCGRTPLVLAFFVTGSSACTRQVDAMQALSRQYPPRVVQFAAVAIRASKADTAAEVRSHRWTIPVAYDRDGAVGQTYGVEICPIAEISGAGGVVARRLIGEHWSTTAALAGQIRAVFGRRMTEYVDLEAAAGFVAPEVSAEFPGLRLGWISVPARRRASPRAVVKRLKDLASRYRGASVVAMRTQPIPSAYRTFFRQIGLDPDVTRDPQRSRPRCSGCCTAGFARAT